MILYLCTHSYIGKAHLNSACYGVIMVIFHVPTSLCVGSALVILWRGPVLICTCEKSPMIDLIDTVLRSLLASQMHPVLWLNTIPFVVFERSVEFGIELSVGSNTSKSSLQTKTRHFVRDAVTRWKVTQVRYVAFEICVRETCLGEQT